MRYSLLALAILFVTTSSFAQTANNEPLGGKINDSKPPPTNNKPSATTKKAPPKRTANPALSSPCGRNSADIIGESATDKWFSLGQSASKHFWYNPHRTACDAKTSVLKSWIKEVHKDTDGNFALVLYEMKCKTNQLRVKTVIEYDSAGGLLETNNKPDDEPWQDVAPGTAGEVMMRTACRRP
jgi:hypothetical protein